VIGWRDHVKPRRIVGIVRFLADESIETKSHLKRWLETSGNILASKNVKGVGDKMADYLKWLAGIPITAIDHHPSNFLRFAGIHPAGCHGAQRLIHQTADLMGLSRTVLDYSIWKYVSQRKDILQTCRGRRKGVPAGHAPTGAIEPHKDKVVLEHAFGDVWGYLDDRGPVDSKTTAGTYFEAIAGIAKNDELVVISAQNESEYARVYACHWGCHYNCTSARVGLYAKALDDHMTSRKI
jgi:hypothetical protein